MASAQFNWTNRANTPPSRQAGAMAYDAARNQIVLFGGYAYPGQDNNDTWVWDGANWIQKNPAHKPPARSAFAMAYDAQHQQVVLFGGQSGYVYASGTAASAFGTSLADTWVWDGNDWTQVTPSGSPQARGFHTLAYDAVRGQVVLFGGLNYISSSNYAFLNDTWTWNGFTWTQQNPVNSPSARRSHMMTWDDARGQVVLFGGMASLVDDPNPNGNEDTWIWDGSNWTVKATSGIPNAYSGALWDAAMAYDSNRRRVVMTGGRQPGAANGNYIESAWAFEWDGQQWTGAPTNSGWQMMGPYWRRNHMMAYDPVRNQMLFFGGIGVFDNNLLNDTWFYYPNGYVERPPMPQPGERMIYDAARQQMLMLGGSMHQASYWDFGYQAWNDAAAETYVWDGVHWQQKFFDSTQQVPAWRTGYSLAYDSVRQQAVLFGGWYWDGVQNVVYLNDTWVWDGANWTNKAPLHSPSVRFGAAMAFDAVHGKIVLLGGNDGGNNFYNDTWTWDGTDWTQVVANVPMSYILVYGFTQPALRQFAGMAWSPAAQKIVLFGGLARWCWWPQYCSSTWENAYVNDTWTWDGTTWTAVNTAHAPPERESPGMDWDANLGKMLVYGGDSYIVPLFNDTWVFDGNDWTKLTPATSPPARSYFAMGFDGARNRMLMSGGSIDGGTRGVQADTWTFGPADTTGTILVQTNNAAASYTVSGPVLYSGNGQTADWSNAPPGNYTIMYGQVNGTVAPSSETQTLAAGGAIVFARAYEVQPGSVSVTANLAAASFTIQGELPMAGAGTSFSRSGVPPGTYTISWAPVAGYVTPAGSSATLTAGGSIAFSGQYTAVSATGTITVTANLAGAAFTLSGAGSYSGGGTNWSQAGAPAGLYTISWTPVTGYVTPTGSSATLTAGGSIGFSGQYTATPGTGTITVTSNLAGGSFNISGAGSYSGSGTNWSRAGAPAGLYTISWTPVAGYITPAGSSATLTAGGSINFSGQYAVVPAIGTITVTTNLAGGSFNISGAGSYSGSGTSWSQTGAPAGFYTISYGAVAGYTTPASQTLALAAGGAISFTGAYASAASQFAVSAPAFATIGAAFNFTVTAKDAANNTVTSYTGAVHFTSTDSSATLPANTTLINGAATLPATLRTAGIRTITATDTVTASIAGTSDAIAVGNTATINVITNLAGATFSLTGAGNYSGSGTNWSQAGAVAGSYTITYGAVTGYTTPGSQTQTLAAGGSVAFNGAYQPGTPATNVGWVLKTPAPWGRSAYSAIYDAARHQVVMFGGTRGANINETWVYDGTAWTHKKPVHSPPAQQLPPLAYDSANQKAVLSGSGTPSRETWTWDGSDWSQLSPATSPTGPTYQDDYPAIAYDAARQQTVRINNYCGDTWIWDGSNWSQKASVPIPSQSGLGCFAAYDAARSQVVLVTYYLNSGSVSYDTWTWDGTAWTQRATVTVANYTIVPSSVPVPAPLVYDPAHQQMVLFDSNGATWVWGGSSWTKKSPANSPSKRSAPLVFDPVSSQVWMIGGTESGTNFELTNDIWAWDGTTWTKKASTPANPVRNGAALAYDAARGEVMQFGGANLSQWPTDTWVWDGSVWTQRTPVTSPPMRADFPMAFDAARQQVVTFGGDGQNVLLNDTWVWDGTNWTKKSPTRIPPVRRGNMMAYDAVHQVVVMFGGRGSNSGTELNDTWTWDGTNWTQMNPASKPLARELGAMSFDVARGKVVLFGGGDTGTVKYNDTWEWDGTNWTKRTPANSPPVRGAHAMAYDAVRGYMVMFGGNITTYCCVFAQDTWTWDGTNWTQQNSANSPPATITGMAFDGARGQVMTFGGWTVPHMFAEDVWVWDKLTGAIAVSTNLAGATFTLSGPDSYSGSGTSLSQAGAPAGSYTITYGTVPGYSTPASQTQILEAGGSIGFTGTYTSTTGGIGVTTNLATATFTLTGPATYSGTGTSWSQTNSPEGSYTIAYSAVSGYNAPPPQTLTLAGGGIIAFTGTYTAAAAQFAVSAPASATVGTAFNFTVTARDAANNNMTGYSGNVHFTSNDSQAVLPADAVLTNGTGTFSATMKTAGNRTITASDTVTASITGSSAGIVVSAIPAWTVASAHTGNFIQGQQGATYTLTVSNPSAAPSSGAVTVLDTIPAGLTPVSIAGTGWTCSTNSCTRSDSLAAGAVWPAITLTVNVSANAVSPQVNQVGVSGGGLPAGSASDSTSIGAMPGGTAALFGTIAGKSGTRAARQWTIQVGNSGTGAAAAAQIAGIRFTQTALGGGGACTPVVTSPAPFPLTLGNILAGASAQGTITINFTGCANAAEFTVLVQLSANGGSSTGSILRNDEER